MSGMGAYQQLWRIVSGAVEDAFTMHPDYFTQKGMISGRASIIKRVTGTVYGFAEQARGRPGLRPAADTEAPATSALRPGGDIQSVTGKASGDQPKENDGSPEDGRREDQDMLNVLKTAQVAQGPLSFVAEGFTTFSPIEANIVLKEAAYDRQRKISPDHVSVLADLMRRKEWEPRDKIDFAEVGGKLILVNGYHRMTAQVMSGATVEWTVVIHRCKDESAVRALYYKFDTNTRIRTNEQIMAGVDFAGTHGLSGKVASALFGAIPVIASNFKANHKAKDILTMKVMDRRLRVAGEYVVAAKKLQTCLDGAPVKVRAKLLRGGVTAVALVTLRYQPIRAAEFWTGVVQNDGLRRNDPRLALHNDLLSRGVNGNSTRAMATSYIPARAWNAFFFGEELQQIRVPAEPVVSIAGTPFEE